MKRRGLCTGKIVDFRGFYCCKAPPAGKRVIAFQAGGVLLPGARSGMGEMPSDPGRDQMEAANGRPKEIPNMSLFHSAQGNALACASPIASGTQRQDPHESQNGDALTCEPIPKHPPASEVCAEITSAPIADVIAHILGHKNLSHSARLLAVTMAVYGDVFGACTLSQEDYGRLVGLAGATVSKGKRDLVRAGLAVRIERGRSGGPHKLGEYDRYRIIDPSPAVEGHKS